MQVPSDAYASVAVAGKISSMYPVEEQVHEPSGSTAVMVVVAVSAARRLTELVESRPVVEQRAESESGHS